MTKVNITLALALVLSACVAEPSNPAGEKERKPVVQTTETTPETTPEKSPEPVKVSTETEISVEPKQKLEKIVESIYGSRFSACEKYENDIDSAVKTYWGTYQYPKAWMAQIYQESLCKTGQTSHAGAKGLAQFMPLTWQDMEKDFGFTANPHDDIAIEWGAYYMAGQMAQWKTRRPMHEKWRLGLASYNAGIGNILGAQKLCDNAPMWDQIKFCLKWQTSEDHAHETKTYVSRIERWWQSMAATTPWDMPRGLWRSTMDKKFVSIGQQFEITRCFNGEAWGTYWKLWDGWATADHVHTQHDFVVPNFITGPATRTQGIDMVVIGTDLPETKPRRPKKQEPIYVLGIASGTDDVEVRFGTVNQKRISSGSPDPQYYISTYVGTIEHPPNGLFGFGAFYDPIYGGMSGGVVLSTSLEPLGVLIGSSETFMQDLDLDGKNEFFFDFVALSDYYDYRVCLSQATDTAAKDACANKVSLDGQTGLEVADNIRDFGHFDDLPETVFDTDYKSCF